MFFLILLILILSTLYFYFKKKYSYWKKRGIKGPKPIWFFGNSVEELFSDPNKKEKENFKKYGKVFGTYRGTIPNFNTSDPEHVRQVLSDTNIFYNLGPIEFTDKYFSSSILFRNGKDWINGRKAQTHFFTSKKIKSLFNHFESSIYNFLNNVKNIQEKEKTETTNFKLLTLYMCIDVISKLLFSIEINSFEQKNTLFVKNSVSLSGFNKFQALLINFLPLKISYFFKLNFFKLDVLNKVGDMFKTMVKKRENDGVVYNDLVELIKEANKTKNLNLTEDEIIGNSMVGYFAGVNLISDVLCSIMFFLIHDNDEKKKLMNEIEKEFSDEITYEKLVDNNYLDAVINETLRLITNTKVFSRTAMIDTYIGEYKIEKGTEIKAIGYILSHSEEYFPNPEKFDPNRFLDKSSTNPNIINSSTYLPFGEGPKQCIGKRFSLVFMKYFLVKFFLKYDVYKCKDYKKNITCIREFNLYETFVIGVKEKKI